MSRFHHNFLIWIIIILHVVGAVGSLIPATSALVISLTPVNLLISTVLLLYGSDQSKKNLLAFLTLSFVIGLSVEVIGVATGVPFGNYSYGNTLGLKVLDVPLIIGINWFLLAYAFGCLANESSWPWPPKVLAAAAGMTLLDFLIEPVAIMLDYWNWEAGTIPTQNYLAWFGISVIIQLIFQKLLPKEKNFLSIPLILSQVFYFLLVYIFFKI